MLHPYNVYPFTQRGLSLAANSKSAQILKKAYNVY